MSEDFHNANNALRFLQGKGIDTSAGRVFLASDVEEAIRQSEQLDPRPQPKTMAQAKRMIRMDPDIMAGFERAQKTDIAGSAISAAPDPSSRT